MTGFFFFNGELCDVTVTGVVYMHCVKFKLVTDQLANVNELLLFCTALWYWVSCINDRERTCMLESWL